MFGGYELAELAVAEHECPWGEMAENYRMVYLGSMLQAVMAADGKSAAAAWNRAVRIHNKLFGPPLRERPGTE